MSKSNKISDKCSETMDFIIVNPECIPIAQRRLVKFFYDAYIRETDINKAKGIGKKEECEET